MLAPQNDYGYSHAMGGYQQQQQQQPPHGLHHQHSGERPKLFGLESGHPGLHGSGGGSYHTPSMHDFQQIVHQSNMTPQHHQQQQQQSDFDHEPLMMSMQHASQYYPPPQMGAQMLHVSTDYGSSGSVGGATPSSGSKRSREELNLKEKKRMFKLNDRINQLKEILDEAGVQSKKNKQSILDNTFHYVSMLRSNLLIAKQKAERSEKQAESYRAQAQQQSGGGMDAVYKRCFDQSSTPRLVVDMTMQLVAVNSAFLAQTGQTEESLLHVDNLRASLCLDNGKLDAVIQSVSSTMKPISAIVQAQGPGNNISTLTLMAAVVTDDDSNMTAVEFSLVPFEISSDFSPNVFQSSEPVKPEHQKEASPSGSGAILVHASTTACANEKDREVQASDYPPDSWAAPSLGTRKSALPLSRQIRSGYGTRSKPVTTGTVPVLVAALDAEVQRSGRMRKPQPNESADELSVSRLLSEKD
ncbi:hypothetical protein BBJ28_00011361 [Nothophytophthora sp. Chile5]|nr:hypothetical protein BBJ28_00011361 [Nothophytophthora sp. Chile5]